MDVIIMCQGILPCLLFEWPLINLFLPFDVSWRYLVSGDIANSLLVYTTLSSSCLSSKSLDLWISYR